MSELIESLNFYHYAMELFVSTGHVSTLTPIFFNHSPQQFIYFDCSDTAALSRSQRELFLSFSNVSKLFSVNDCVFFSISLFCNRWERSQVAHDIHTMLHPLDGSDGTICLFRFEDEVMFSFSGFEKRCILSDWYPMDDDYGVLHRRLDIANVSIGSGAEYFSDLVYYLARSYYTWAKEASVYDLLPIDFLSSLWYDTLDREQLDQIVRAKLTEPEQIYGDDYVEYDNAAPIAEMDLGADLDLMLLEMDEEDDNPFDEEVEDDEEDEFEDDEYVGDIERDEYEFDNFDPSIFQDPTLMVKWLNRQDSDSIIEEERRVREEAERKAREEEAARKAEEERRLQEELRVKAEEERRLREEAERKAREEEAARKAEEERRLQEELRAKAEEERRLREKAERKAREEEAARKAEEERRLQEELRAKEEEERHLREEAEQRRREAELRLAEEQATYDELQADIKLQKRIIDENRSWFGSKARVRKAAQEALESLLQTLSEKYPNGRPT